MAPVFLIIALTLLSIFYPSFAMDKPQSASKELEKKAWKLAYAGDFQAAQQHFFHAAQAGSLRAALVLQQDLKSSTDTAQADPAKTVTIHNLVETCKNIKFQEYLEEGKKESNQTSLHKTPENYAQYWLDAQLHRLPWEIKSKTERVQTFAFSRQNPWYQSVLEVLQKQKDIRFHDTWKNKFVTPVPEEGICELIKLYFEGKIDEHEKTLFCAIRETKSEKVINYLLEKLNRYDHPKRDLYRKKLLTVLHPIALSNPNFRSQLVQGYNKYVIDKRGAFLRQIASVEGQEHFAEIIAIMPLYYEADPTAAQKELDNLISDDIEDLGHYHGQLSNLNDRTITLLAMARKYQSPKFPEYAQQVATKNTDMYLALAFTHPALAKELDGTALDVTSLIRTALASPKAAYSNGHHPLRVIISKGSACHIQYQNEIAAQLPVYFKDIFDYWLLMKLLDSPSVLLQQCALDVLIDLVSKPVEEKNQFLKDSLVNKQPLAVKELFTKFSGNATFAARLFMALKNHENHLGMQTMITETIDRKENDSTWQELVCSYLNVSPDVVIKKVAIERPSTQQYISAAILTAQQCNCLSNNAIRSLLNASTQTGFSAHMDSQLVATLSWQSLLLDETASLAERVKIVDLLYIQNRTQLPTIKAMINGLTQSAFKEYACTLMEILESGTAAQDVAIRYPKLVKLHELHAQHPDLPALPEAFTHFFGKFYDPFRMVRAEAKSVIPFGDFYFTQLGTQALLFGYILNDTRQREERLYYRLYAYDLNGLPVWASPFTHAASMPFKLFGPYLFCPVTISSSNGVIIQYDQKTGTHIDEWQLPEPCNNFFITPKGILYSIGKESITIYDLHTKQNKIVARPKPSTPYYANSVGEHLVLPCDNNLVLLNPDGTNTNLTTGNEDSKFDFTAPASGTDRYLLYATKEGASSYLTCFDRITSATAWKLPLIYPMKRPVIVMPDEKKYFVFTKQMIIAFESPEGLGQSPREIWRLLLNQIAPKEAGVYFENIFLSSDKKTLLVIANFGKSAEVISLNPDNGTFNSLGYVATDWGITLGYAGTYQDKVYLEHITSADARSCL